MRSLQTAAAACIGLVGLFILARLDIPHIESGGWPAVLAGADLTFFTVLLGAGLTLGTLYGSEDDERRP